ncbi:chloroplast envelope quinone oxidoreductase homolog [Oryza brachyantha]|uniref:chloroplast envelope quinone oxidoreductase homolog n=1 Tax=Oryza brachyantha TaxID=4533 RepID=UPI001AD96C9D|nr:chloroplast envelope quinone oxidoreductase homolog [Oryza brachyantha]
MATSSRRMRAVQYDKYGGGAQGLKHVEVPIPAPKKGEVLIRVEAASINQVDWKFQKGIARPFLPKKFPFTPGYDLAGEVVELGSGVSCFEVGDKVIAINFPDGGGLAEYAVARASRTAVRTTDVAAADGACLPIAAGTALVALRTAGVSLDGGGGARKNVLVTAASGGVGHFAVQLARLGGHRVTATCGARNVGLVGRLGADEVLDYATPEGAALRSPSGRRYDAVVHCATGFPWSAFSPALADAGVVVDVTPGAAGVTTALWQRATFSKKRLVPLFVSPTKEDMELLVGMAREGRLKAVIESRCPLSRAEECWAKSMSGHVTGKAVVVVGEEE